MKDLSSVLNVKLLDGTNLRKNNFFNRDNSPLMQQCMDILPHNLVFGIAYIFRFNLAQN